MKISKEFEWLREYVEAVLPLLPQDKKISRIIQWCMVRRKRGKNYQAYCITSDYVHFRIYIRKWYLPRGEKVATPYSKIDTLSLLAHELAHLMYMEHSPAHKKLESKITSVFMTKLASTGYESEEKELSEINEVET